MAHAEPTAHLDAGREWSVLELVRALAREGLAVLAVIHDLALAARSADRPISPLDGSAFEAARAGLDSLAKTPGSR